MKLTSNPYAKMILARTPADFAKLNCRVVMRDGVKIEPPAAEKPKCP